MKLSQKIALAFIRLQFRILSFVAPQKAAQKAFGLFCTPRRKKQSPGSPVLNNAGLLAIAVNNYLLHGYSWNAGGEKKILVIHGFESTATNFCIYVDRLVQKNYQVIAFDAQAHGKSEGKTITLPEYVHTLLSICKQFGPFDAYMAHSFGGLALAHLLEEIPHSSNTKVVFIAPATETVSAINGFFSVLRLNKKVRLLFEQIVEQSGIRSPRYYSIRRAMNNIGATVLWLHDREDNITPFTDAQRVQDDRHQNIQFIVTQGLGHRKIYRDPTIMQQILDFL
ncbi:MAG: alpha/beta hydrolase [Chitinophagaceae bacterium]|nr:alpha/beta hydrolase [Chitinophagaceae bacterium]